MTDLLARIDAAATRLYEAEYEMASQWLSLRLALGRATQAAAMGDIAEAERWLRAAENHEHDLTTKREVLAPIIASLWPPPQAEWDDKTPVATTNSTRYSSQPPIQQERLRRVVKR